MDYICSPDPFQDIELARISHDVKQRFYNLPAVAEATRMTASGLGRVKTFCCKRSELEEVATRAVFPDFDYALIAAISG
jgi:hypothetical protein